MAEPFRDHFSSLASKYADFRPRYPAELFDFLEEASPRRELAILWGPANLKREVRWPVALHLGKVD